MSNENDNDTPNVTPLRPTSEDIRVRLAASEGQRTVHGGALPFPGERVDEEQTDFEVGVIDPSGEGTVILNFTGFMVATAVFVGFTDETGLLKGVVPMDRLLYVAQADKLVAELLEDDEPAAD